MKSAIKSVITTSHILLRNEPRNPINYLSFCSCVPCTCLPISFPRRMSNLIIMHRANLSIQNFSGAWNSEPRFNDWFRGPFWLNYFSLHSLQADNDVNWKLRHAENENVAEVFAHQKFDEIFNPGHLTIIPSGSILLPSLRHILLNCEMNSDGILIIFLIRTIHKSLALKGMNWREVSMLSLFRSPETWPN